MVHLPGDVGTCNQRIGPDPGTVEPNAMGKTELGCYKGRLAPFLHQLAQGEATVIPWAVPNPGQISEEAKSPSLHPSVLPSSLVWEEDWVGHRR